MGSAVALSIGAVTGALVVELFAPVAVILLAVAVMVAAAGVRGFRAARSTGPARARSRRWSVVALGACLVALRAIAVAPSTGVASIPTGDGPWIATVVSVGSEHGPSRPAVLQLDEPRGLIVAAALPWYPVVGADDRVSVRGRIDAPPPGEYASYLARIRAAGSVRADGLELLPAPAGPVRALEDLRRAAARGLENAMPEPEAGLASGILVGLRDRVDRQLAADFTTAGVSHVVAISGWNIAIVATSIGALAGALGRRRRTVLTGLAILAYVAFVGPSPSVVRAGAMAGLVLVARELGRPSRATAALGWAVTGLLLVDPGYVDDAGFRLSVLATAGLMAWGTRLTRHLAGTDPGRLRGWLAESLGVSLAAQAATLPVILLEFGRLSLVSPAVNVLVVPLVAPAMAAGAIALVAGALAAAGVPAILATIVGLPAWALLAAIVAIVRVGAGVPGASVTLESPWDVAAAMASAAAVVVVATRGSAIRSWLVPRITISVRRMRAGASRASPASAASPARVSESPPPGRSRRSSTAQRAPARGTRVAAVALAASTIALGLAIAHRDPGATTVTVLDVGQGDAILVESATGQRLLVDGGPDPTGLVRSLDERLPPWDRRVDLLVLTHPHEDHVAGLAMLLDRYRIGRVFEPGMIGPGPGYSAWVDALARRGVRHATLATGDRFALDDIAFQVLWPDPGRVPEHPADGGTAINNVSIVLLGTIGEHRFLLAGDIEQQVDPEVLARGVPQVDLLKVAHHGSKTASTEPFLEAVHPRIAIVSAGLGNPYGHPAPATISRLKAIARETYRTDLDGTVEVRFDGDTLRVHTSGPSHRAAAIPATSAAARPSRSVGTTAAAASAGQATVAFACAIPFAGAPRAGATGPELPVVGEAPTVELGQTTGRLGGRTHDLSSGGMVTGDNPRGSLAARVGAWHLDHGVGAAGGAGGLSYHRGDDRSNSSRSDGFVFERVRNRSPRVPLGRRRVRPGRDRRRVPVRRTTLPERRARAPAHRYRRGRDQPIDP